MKHEYRIYLSDPHAIFREGIKKTVSGTEGLVIAGESENVINLKDAVRETKPDLLLLFTIPFKACLEVTETIRNEFPDIKIALLTNVTRHPDLRTAIDKGVSGIIYKAVSEKELLGALDELRKGNHYYSPEILHYLNLKNKFRSAADNNQAEEWSEKELFILKCICKGIDNEEITGLLNLSNRTVEGYKSRMIEKAGVPNTINLVLYAIKNKLVTIKDL